MMPDEDAKIFSEAFEIYNKYRWAEMTSDDQWIAFTDDVRDFADKHKWKENTLAARIGVMLLEVFSELYRDGKKPVIPNYFGRDDL